MKTAVLLCVGFALSATAIPLAAAEPEKSVLQDQDRPNVLRTRLTNFF